jgi:hypothetical protein
MQPISSFPVEAFMTTTRTKLIRLAALAATTAWATSASAFFDVQVLGGKRWYELNRNGETGGVASQEVNVAAHVDPIPLVPVAFGAGVALGNLRKGDWGKDVETAQVFQAGLDIMAWLPFVPVVTPYARIKVPLVGTITTKEKITPTSGGSEELKSTTKLTGYHLNAGVKYSPLPLIKLLVEVGMGMEKSKLDEAKVDGKKVDAPKDSNDAKSKTLLVGLEIGL